MAKKPSIGRQKIKIEKIEVKNHLQVTFSKRRSGLFKKASELCTLCGVEITIIVFSPAGKVFSFGHPNVESIVDRFLARTSAAPNPSHNPFLAMEAHRTASVRDQLNLQLGQILNELEVERSKGESLDSMRKTNQSHYWWEGPIGKLGLDELQQLRDAMEELKKNVCQQVGKLMSQPSTAVFPPAAVFDQFESKAGQGIVGAGVGNAGSSVHNNFGYCIGYF